MQFKNVFPAMIFLLVLILLVFLITSYVTKKSVLGVSFEKPTPNNKTIVLVGDSMTEYLGNFELLNASLKKHYPSTTFNLLNYGFGSTNVLSLEDRFTKASNQSGRILQAINDIPFDLILIESMGNNPLSEYSVDEGIKKQNEVLDKIMEIITQKHPKSSVVFVATIAPNKDWYGYGVVTLLPEQKEQWVKERVTYIKNHMDYAKSHNIPLIDIFNKSLDSEGNGNLDYLNSSDHIHPSPRGLMFISEQIANFINENGFLK